MTNTERAVTWGLLGFIAYQIYQGVGTGAQDYGVSPCGSGVAAGEQLPDWIGQLSAFHSENQS